MAQCLPSKYAPDCTRVLLYTKMLKETETEKHRQFLSHFYHWCIGFISMGDPAPPFGYAYV